jgi:acetyl-CoA acetyltransferase
MDSDNDIVIVGVGETPVGRLPGYGATQLQAWAALDAIEDAGITLKDIDGLINQDPYSVPQSMFALTLSEYLGIRPAYVSTCDVGGSVTVMAMLQTAVWAIRNGNCRYCLVMQGENMATSRPADSTGHVLHTHQGGEAFKEAFGVQGALIPYALVAQRYCHETGVSPDAFGAVAVQMRKNAMRLKNRQTKKPLSIEEYLASPLISDPLRRLDCSLVSDGAAAFIVTTRREARRTGARCVAIKSFDMQASHCSIVEQPDLSELTLPAVTQRALEKCGMGLDEMDLFLVHDAFTVSVLIQLEGIGLCGPGKAVELFERGDADPQGRTPVNPHGGLLSQAHFGGALHGVEAVRQLRGDAEGRQVNGARHALWCGNGGIFSVFGVMVLAKDDQL